MNMNNKPTNYGATSSSREIKFEGTTAQEFNTLCDNVVTNIYTINSSWKQLDSALKNLGTPKDNKGLRDKIHITQLSTNQIVSATAKDLAKLKLIVRKTHKQLELQYEKLEENFKEAVSKYSSLQKTVAEKMKSHLLTIAQIEHENTAPDDKEVQQQMQVVRELAFEQDMLLDREARVRQIEADVLDINEIMRELGFLVNQQGEVIDTIENSIDYATGNVEEGTSELIKASRYQNKYRRKLCYLVILGLVIAIILIIVLVYSLKK